MSEEELELKMKQILDDYAPILNVTPEAPSLEQKPLQTKKEKKEIKKESIESNQTLKTTSEKLQEELEPITSESHSEHTTSQEEK